jgi:hypothetical protein
MEINGFIVKVNKDNYTIDFYDIKFNCIYRLNIDLNAFNKIKNIKNIIKLSENLKVQFNEFMRIKVIKNMTGKTLFCEDY